MGAYWPWMKGTKVAIADPIPSAHDNDDRPAVNNLVLEHRDKIEKLKLQLKDDPLYQPTKHDDLWMLRFLMSHKKDIDASLKAAKHTLQFRSEWNLDLEDIRFVHIGHDPESMTAAARNYQQCCDPTTFRFVVQEVCVVSYIQFAGFNQPKLLRDVSQDDWLPGFAFISEWCHQWCDYLTRTTGRLTKQIRFVDLANVSIKQNLLPEALRRDARALNAMEDVYPQMLQAMFLTNAPIWIEGPWKTIRPLMPQRVLQKFDFLEPAKKAKDLEKIAKYIPMEKLPKRYGGSNPHWPDDTPPPIGKNAVHNVEEEWEDDVSV